MYGYFAFYFTLIAILRTSPGGELIAGWPLTWKTGKSQGIAKWSGKS